jgi:demethylmenaquinone methyltransferase/2-methoxy-6-polyprenyl-1,4-benzoquinol methylase
VDELTSQNPASIQKMFGAISKKYDLANSVLSGGIHVLWKKQVIRESKIQPHQAVLDCATGTGDLSFMFERALQGTGQVIGSDFCEPMLEMAREKAKNKNSKARFEWADVTKLPYSDNQFNVATISFGIRNVEQPKKALQELSRVVKPGGRVIVLEFGQPRSQIMAALYNFYSSWLLPRIGGWISGQRQAYKYLQTSSAAFPCGEQFLDIAESTGSFAKMKYRTFQTGIAYLYVMEVK